MPTTRGVSLVVFIFCVSVAFGLMTGLGVDDRAQAGVNPGIAEEREEVQQGVSEPESSSTEDAGSFVGLATGALKTLDTLRILVFQTATGLENMGVNPAVAGAIEAVVRLSFVLAIVAVLLRFKV